LAGVTVEGNNVKSNDNQKAAPIVYDIRKRKGLKIEVPDTSNYIDKLWEIGRNRRKKIFFFIFCLCNEYWIKCNN